MLAHHKQAKLMHLEKITMLHVVTLIFGAVSLTDEMVGARRDKLNDMSIFSYKQKR